MEIFVKFKNGKEHKYHASGVKILLQTLEALGFKNKIRRVRYKMPKIIKCQD